MKTSVNLMTDETRRQQVFTESRRLWSNILCATLVALTAMGGLRWLQGRTITTQLQALEDRYAPVQALKKECIRLRTDINAMRDAQQLTLQLVDTRPTVTLLGAISAAAAQTDGNVFVEQLTLERGDRNTQKRTAVVAGLGRNNSAIASFTDALRSSELFADVTLSSSDTSQAEDKQARYFRIECQL